MKILALVLLLIALFIVVLYNKLISISNKVDEALATQDVYLKKRFDMLPNLVAVVKEYARYESSTLQQVISARSITNTKDIGKLQQEEKTLGMELSKLFALSESYPELKANANFLTLQSDIKKLEDDIASSRKYYNACVRQLNTMIRQFPTNIVANLFGQKKRDYFIISNDEKQVVSISFGDVG